MQYKFLIYISYSYAIPIGNPLEEEIIKKGYTVKWFSDLEDGKVALQKKQNVIDTIKDVVSYEPHIVLAATNDIPDFISGIKVQIFHGFNAQKRPEAKNSFSHFRIRGFFDLYCTQGPTTTIGFKKQQELYPHFEVIETGWSKVDPLFPIEDKKKESIPTIMIASTFTERLSLAHNDSVFNKIKSLSTSGKYNFKLVLHPKMTKEIVTKWKTLTGPHFTFYDTTDLVPLFKQADILFADTTSAIQEFLLQKKTVVTFNHTFKHNYLIDINDANLIEASFKRALTYPADLIKNIDTFIKDLHPYFDGKSSQRVISATIDFLHKDKKHLKRKPLNLIRKYKIRKRLNFFTLKSYNKPFTK
ncbi:MULTISPECIES: CDP-glycerol glycerophosphotransferase [unclassified Algibacter]|uniref:CDP-glycerol glycerophosphotransferase n=1 Tax=unclassified Algibacter TaxID=2615009 RepID=UPI00131E8AFD|nr:MULTISPECIES: CDP-glycerol glycerophosphotransferase [unclassified Algibacter]MCL5129754.1 CDP-glycerol glycerophosphotransferase [Algibacter sp. L4_22]